VANRVDTAPEIYLDNAATTAPAPAVVEAMRHALEVGFANPSSRHRPGLEARRLVEEARATIARYAGLRPEGVIFTSGGTEANNLAGRGWPLRSGTRRVLTSAAEHPSVAAALELRPDARPEAVPLGPDGTLDLDELATRLDEKVGLVAVFEGQNEIGSRNPVAAIAALVQERAPRALLHLDCVQSFGKNEPPPFALGIASASISGHKIRAGIVGLASAVALLEQRSAADKAALVDLRIRLERGILAALPGARLLAADACRLPHIVTVVLPGARGEVVVHHLEQHAIYASTSAACHSRKSELSPALLALGLTPEEVRSTVRLSLSPTTTATEVERVLRVLPSVVSRVQALSARP
jgi:cysteine desulfurase